ncbi:MAG: bifunctional folylpolyglutamate synthase/dihydrofolate synthase [Acidobacteria bacterium]|nr:bifunctional folylpolyglutamate synthase/dihydrofolate synthase [Acidobacteriota bacterium]MBI3280321.1 bifunctional folylpolyglutamate synthase/dihydrofolate synthase [Acidobacteriota bacterium]
MTYRDSVEYLYSLGNELKSVKFGLESIGAVLAELGDPQRAFRSIHVAGTNGKGSTCALIESALRAAGVRTGLYTSPHLVEPTERIRIAGRPVPREQFAAAFETIHETAERLLAQNRLEYHPTYFETVTAMAFLLFREQAVDTAVVEAGLGGRLDATNVVDPRLCVITQIDFDHERFLGSSLPGIAGEKAGILKPGVPAVFSRQRPEADAVLTGRASELGITVRRTSEYALGDVEVRARASRFRVCREGELRIHCPLAGEHQIENAVTAIAALEWLGVAPAAIAAGITAARWPARLEYVRERPDIILDGAHNPAGARALAAYIRRFCGGRGVWLVYGAMRDKSVEEITEVLFPLARTVLLTQAASPRALHPDTLRAMTDHADARVVPALSDAVALARTAPPGDAVFITGSLYLAGEARALLITDALG